ncbi:MAG: hypothetical protein EZS28_016481 [Streblomastix strix]|uniref:Uncharacterized protein n=1 Tax=Streblomastix strix TaxID=222440 RepID=A0A5J4W0I5_9EUKA|nr:MAG: hypothetical protein EZS28_016481 [Streblomastix strix]
MESQEKPSYFHWSKYSNEQKEEFIKEAIEKQDEELAKMWRQILYLKLLNLKTHDNGLIQQSIGIAPFHNIGQPYPIYANITAFKGMLAGVPLNLGFIALSTIENKVYPDSHQVFGSE